MFTFPQKVQKKSWKRDEGLGQNTLVRTVLSSPCPHLWAHSIQSSVSERKFLADWQCDPGWADMNNLIWLLQQLSLQNLHGEGFLGFFFPEIWMYLRSSNSTGTSFSWQQPGPAETDEVYQRGRCLWVQLSCLMPPLPRNIQINCYSNQPSFVPYRAVRFSEPVYSNCNKNSLTFYSKQPNLPKCTHLHSHCINSEIVPAQLPSGYVTAMMYTILVTLGAHEVPEIFLHIGGTFWTGFTVLSQYGMVALCWRSP